MQSPCKTATRIHVDDSKWGTLCHCLNWRCSIYRAPLLLITGPQSTWIFGIFWTSSMIIFLRVRNFCPTISQSQLGLFETSEKLWHRHRFWIWSRRLPFRIWIVDKSLQAFLAWYLTTSISFGRWVLHVRKIRASPNLDIKKVVWFTYQQICGNLRRKYRCRINSTYWQVSYCLPSIS